MGKVQNPHRRAASRGRPHARTGRLGPALLVRRPHLLRRRFFPHLSLPRPLSQRLHRSLPPSSRPITPRPLHLNLVLCVLLRLIRGDALSSAVVLLSRKVWVLQKSHAHPLGIEPGHFSRFYPSFG